MTRSRAPSARGSERRGWAALGAPTSHVSWRLALPPLSSRRTPPGSPRSIRPPDVRDRRACPRPRTSARSGRKCRRAECSSPRTISWLRDSPPGTHRSRPPGCRWPAIPSGTDCSRIPSLPEWWFGAKVFLVYAHHLKYFVCCVFSLQVVIGRDHRHVVSLPSHLARIALASLNVRNGCLFLHVLLLLGQ